MHGSDPILDYASPRKRTTMRLPAKSALVWDQKPDRFVVTERLAADTRPVVTSLVLVALLFFASIGVCLANATRESPPRFKIDDWAVPIGLHAIEFVVALMVVHQTWRRTELRVCFNQIELLFWSPFRRRLYRWGNNDILSITLSPTHELTAHGAIGELLIVRADGGPVHLFTDHLTSYLTWMTAAVESYLRNGVPPP